LILVAALATYIPAMSAGFIWDDAQHLTRNSVVRDPIGIWRAWVSPDTANSFPLTASVFWLQVRLGDVFHIWNLDFLLEHADGGVFSGYHVVNILLHGIAAVLTWRVLLVLRIPGAWAVALIFAVHPVCVASVAWISELKNTLSQVLFLLTLLTYLWFDANERTSTYLWAVVWFCLALLAKPSVVPLPAVLLLYSWWQRGEIARRDAVRAAPFLVAASIAGIAAVYLPSGGGAGAEVIPIGGPASRVASAGISLCFYLSKAICPLNLIPIYPAWDVALPAWHDFLPAVALVVVFVVYWRQRIRSSTRAMLFALGYYTIMLLPALGLVKMSYMRVAPVADHFQYLALPGIIALAVVAAMRWLPRPAWTPVAAVVVMTLSGLSWMHSATYRNEEALWTETLKRNPHSWQAHNLLGVALWKKGDPASQADMFMHFQRAAELNPENLEVHNNLALVYAARGRMDLAIEEYTRAINIKDDASVRTNLAIAFSAVKRYADAEAQYQRAVEIDPGNPSRYSNLGYVLMQQGRLAEAIEQFRKALQIDPNLPEARQNLRFAVNQLERRQDLR